MNILYTLSKIFRIRPVVAWSMTSTILVMFAGIYDGMAPDLILAFLALLGISLLQGIVSHAVNDIVDEKVDKDTDMKKTGRFKVLVGMDGNKAKTHLYILIFCAFFIVWIILWHTFCIRGYQVIICAFLGIFFIYAYNFSPFKLNYRPLGEYTIVLPVILTISFGMGYVIFGKLSATIINVAVINALVNMSWYMFSRLQDIVPDNSHNKVTTFVWIRRNFNMYKEDWVNTSFIYIFATLAIFSYIIAIRFGGFYFITSALIVLYMLILVGYIKKTNVYLIHNISSISAKMRRLGMYITYANCILLSLTLYLYK